MNTKKIHTALISVYHKDGLDDIIISLHQSGVSLYSTGGTQSYIEGLGVPVTSIESLTGYPSILDGRVKTLHPKVFGGILARREKEHHQQLEHYEIPAIDLVIVDLYPFEETLLSTNVETEIIEKIDIGGISLIRAAAKNYKDVVVVPSKDEYPFLLKILKEQNAETSELERKELARRAYKVSSNYDTAIFQYFNEGSADPTFKYSIHQNTPLRYGENPHQSGIFFGNLEKLFDKLNGKEISYNNLVDIDAAVQIIQEFHKSQPTFAILKHTNSCGVATRATLLEAWKAALACDSVSAFGGVFICNKQVDIKTAAEIDAIFYEVLIAPDFEEEALSLLKQKKNRILLRLKDISLSDHSFKSILNGVIRQDADHKEITAEHLTTATNLSPTLDQIGDLLFARKCVKHLKSNAIALVKNYQLIGMGCGQPSRVDALRQAIGKAKAFGFDLTAAVMASDAFFPFPDCVEIAHEAGIKAVIQPGGSIKDQESIDFCNNHEMSMVMTGTRSFRH
jgi:phosphoribosylaminoimidazolecarboxamide formyltransferase/IMP cyclohydrolase